MKTKLLLLSMSLFIVTAGIGQEYLQMIDEGTHAVSEIIENGEAYFADKDKGRGTGYKQFKRWEYNATRLMNQDGYLTPMTDRIAELERYNAYLNNTAENRQVLNDNWLELGPTSWNATTSWNPGVGRITSIAIDPADSNHIIVGANTGGVWKTTDGGTNWTPLNDNFTNLFVYSVVMDPSNSSIYYFGSSSGLIFKSIDAGATWNLLGDIGASIVNRILIHPTDSNIMFATSQNGGIRKSTDGGVTWATAVSDGNGYDVEFKPGDPSVVYASGTGFHKSNDGGATFTTIAGFTSGPKMIGVSPADDTVVYVLEAAGGSFGGFYASTDSGDSFTELNHTGRNYFGYDNAGIDPGGQAPRDMDVAVKTDNAFEVHIAGVHTWRSMDGGVTFENTSDWVPSAAAGDNIGYCHADVDILVFDGTTLYVGSDGGIFKATDTGNLTSNYYTDITKGIGIRQFYKIGVSQTANVVISGGAQDNGTSFYTATNDWRDWLGADGMESFIDKEDSNIMYGTSQGGQLYRTDDGAISYTGLSEPGPGGGNWVTPFEQDPIQSNTVYLGYNAVYKSINKGENWTSISQNLGGDLDEMKIAPSNNQIIYATRGSRVYRTEDGGTTDWVETTLLPGGGTISSIAVHPTNPNKVAISIANVSKVFVSNDGGVTWENYLFNLPDFSSLAVVWDDNGKDGLYLGMNYGVYYIDNTFSEWQPYSNGIPNVIVNELDINNETNMLYAGTYGRGLWASPLVDDLVLSVSDVFSENSVQLYPNPSTTEITIGLKETTEADIRVFNILGKLVMYKADVLVSNTHTLNVSSFTSGTYFVRINSDKGTVTKKFIKE